MIHCSVTGCISRHKGRGYCDKHLQRFKKYGSPSFTKQIPLDASNRERLEFYGWTVTPTGCWEWNAYRDKKGYGKVTTERGTRESASRVAYTVWVGPLRVGELVRHTCDNPPCMNPAHLRSGSYKDNSQDMMARGRWKGNDRISSTDACDIRILLGLGARPIDIAEAYAISRASVYDIRKERSWTNHDGDNT